MTREEAIINLKVMKEHTLAGNWYEEEALEMAISALEQQPCEDAVSREPCRTCKYGEIYNDEWCRCTYPKISGCRVRMRKGCEVENCYEIAPYKESDSE